MYKDSIKFLGSYGAQNFEKYLKPLKEELVRSNLGVLFELYVGKMIFFSIAAFITTFVFVTTTTLVIGATPLFAIGSGLVTSAAVSLAILTLYHSYPFQLLTSKKNSIESNLPFAINHMAAISSSGVPPFIIFKLLANIHEYAEISNESRRIVRNVDTFGMDAVSAMKNVADRTPSSEFKQLLYGVVSTMETGGDLRRFLDNASKESLFNYRIKREKYLQTLGTYADFYTAVLIAAPLFFISILSVMSLIGGEIFGLSIPVAMKVGVYAMIPLMNILFLLFVHYTQPQV